MFILKLLLYSFKLSKPPLVILMNFLKCVGRKTRGLIVGYKMIAGFGLSVLTFALVISPILLKDDLPQVLFATASVQAALGFYIYSIGNTIFTVAESMGEPDYIEDGIAVNGNATLMIASAGGLIVLGIINSANMPHIEFTLLQQDLMTMISLAVLSFTFFLPAVLLHGDYHTWRGWNPNEYDESDSGGLKHEMSSRNIENLYNRIEELEGEKETNLSEVMDKLEEITNDVSNLKGSE